MCGQRSGLRAGVLAGWLAVEALDALVVFRVLPTVRSGAGASCVKGAVDWRLIKQCMICEFATWLKVLSLFKSSGDARVLIVRTDPTCL